ncbi:pre-mRNA splicing factor [Aspergillus terreus]|uniref:Pre-mRNA splicing factor n=1 Tax=Aspergillus terreus TaxID=33178 RepID=A0A5M3YN70_ASPTE|nr:hypothetical protein ATETN484_0002004800 [Aspergillus terreus]GFF13697.1 pre-mRNA splicing factor [Aspergillus terreus]
MTSQLPTSNLLVRVISQKFRQLLGQSTDPSNDDKFANTGDNQDNAAMVFSDGASPFLPPPTLDVNPAKFEQGDNFVQGIMDEILTDEAEYDRSFDEYTGTRPASVDRGDEQSESASEGINVAAETEEHSEKMLPYSSPCPSYKRQKLQQGKETSNSSENEDESDQNAASSPEESSSEESSEHVDDEKEEERRREEFILEPLSFTQREEFLHFIKNHPFVWQRPIRRTARRQFLRDICDKASEIGLNQERIALLERHIRKLYLEIRKIDADPEGSEFGPELDDEYVPTGPANTQKRKWDSDKETSSKFRRIKREFSEEILPGRMASDHDVDREVDTLSMEDSAISVSEGDSSQTNLDHARPDLAQESSVEKESDSDEVASKGPGVEKAADAVKSATGPLEQFKSPQMASRPKSTSTPPRSPDDAKKGGSSTPRKRSSHMPSSHATPSEKIVVVLDSSSSKSSNAPDSDSLSDTTSNADRKKLQREKKRMKKRNRRQAKRDRKRRDSLTNESTALSESQPKSHVPSKQTGAKAKKNSATGHGNTAFDDNYWDLTDF